jgi:hypothetical protein
MAEVQITLRAIHHNGSTVLAIASWANAGLAIWGALS